MKDAPNCYECIHRLPILGDAHSRCNNHGAKVTGNPTGIRRGWFIWPLNYDPTWLESCDAFSDNAEDKQPIKKLDPLMELMSILK